MDKVLALAKRYRPEAAAVAAVVAAAVDAGMVHGTTLRVASTIVAVAAAAGVYRKPVKK